MPRLTTVVASLAIGVLLYFSLVAGIDGQRTLAAIQRMDPAGWLGIFGLSLANYGLRFVRWHGYMRWLGHRVPLVRHLLVYLAGFALTTTPGKAGEGVRAVYLARRRIPYAHSVAAMFAERLLDLLAIIALSCLAILSFSGYAVWVIAPLAVIAGLLAAMHNRRLLKYVQRRVEGADGMIAGVAHVFVHAWERAFVLLSWRPLIGGFLIGCLAWAAEGVALYLIADRLDISLGVTMAVGIYATSMLIGALSFVPGGLGSTEAAMTILLKLTGIASTAALTVVLIARLATLWFAVLLGLCCLVALEIEHRWLPAHGRPST
ncbi:lysylphosphatidylglycerol synthase transmembrane domain-containing protein [Salinisphaera sp. Q1T1-3]|uniref:lysylphosphatidylglycerol synthase transmembrane domain-containing protein n=1 Tax=Salinisphaera sp. Q1T1-3 TaxID=2321229 RepID=UPI001314A8C2|nr:lysylphosphatidylglycerol synthase transmembrane domain-containing protein [Salinisphaera sp. Q1T1-3]